MWFSIQKYEYFQKSIISLSSVILRDAIIHFCETRAMNKWLQLNFIIPTYLILIFERWLFIYSIFTKIICSFASKPRRRWILQKKLWILLVYELNFVVTSHISVHICEKWNGGCDHICVESGEEKICKCRDGFVLSEKDGEKCNKCKLNFY